MNCSRDKAEEGRVEGEPTVPDSSPVVSFVSFVGSRKRRLGTSQPQNRLLAGRASATVPNTGTYLAIVRQVPIGMVLIRYDPGDPGDMSYEYDVIVSSPTRPSQEDR